MDGSMGSHVDIKAAAIPHPCGGIAAAVYISDTESALHVPIRH